MRAAVRERVAYEALPRRYLPERLPLEWTLCLIFVDAFAVLAACYAISLPATVGPAACVIVCGAMALIGAFQVSYAVHWRDEIYHVLAGCALAALPLLIVLVLVGQLPAAAALFTLALSAVFMSTAHALLHRARHAGAPPAYARAISVTPEAQWRVGRSPYRAFKRVADVVLAIVALVLLSPLLLLTATCIAIETGFPVIFRQERIGQANSRFLMFKFRTMYLDAGETWARPGDARITPLGAILRRCSIDELPQLLNVLRGEMSLVGPRPEMCEFAREFGRTIPHYDERHVVLPGLTGWAQVQAKRNLEPGEMANVTPYDLFYVENASPALDAIVIIKTAVEFVAHRAV